jgi:ATP-dependent helicase/nuclease subunit A
VITAAADVHGRILAAAPDETAAAVRTVAHVLAHAVLRRARAANARGACRREPPVTLTADAGTLVEGLVDLGFEESGRWMVVDYKTDRELRAIGEEQYRRQVELYASAIAKATGQPADGIILRL